MRLQMPELPCFKPLAEVGDVVRIPRLAGRSSRYGRISCEAVDAL